MYKNVFYLAYQEKDYGILYAPLQNRIACIDSESGKLFRKIKTSNELKTCKEYYNKYVYLVDRIESELGIYSDEDHNKIKVEKLDVNRDFSQVLLILTLECNLECIYCYSEGGNRKLNMDLKIARAGVDLLIENTLKNNSKYASLVYHGGGEPTINWKVLMVSTKYFLAKTKEINIKPHLTIATNGIISDEKRAFLIKYFNEIYISLDGVKEYHDKQRPFPNGKSSFSAVFETIKCFDNFKKEYSIQTIATKSNIDHLKKFVDFMEKNMDCKNISIIPVMGCGRCSYNNADRLKPIDLADKILEIIDYAKSKRIELKTTIGNIDVIKSRACDSFWNAVYIMPEGYVSTCVQVAVKKDKRSSVFFVGKYDKVNNKFDISDEKYDFLKTRNVWNIEECSNCFMKWHCSGGCGAYSMNVCNDLFSVVKETCLMNRHIAKELLYRKICYP